MRFHMLATGLGARGRSRGLRVFALAFAFLQICLQGTFAVSDGYEEIASSHVAPVHIETPGNHHHRLHSDDCVVCHVLASGSTVPPRATPVWLLPERAASLPSAALEVRLGAAVNGARRARAPPVTV